MSPSVVTPVLSSVYCCLFVLAGGGALHLVEQLEVFEDDEWKLVAEGAVPLRGGGKGRSRMIKGTELRADQWAIETVNQRGQLKVTLTSSAREKALQFDRKFLRSGDRRVTHFATEEGTEYRITHWGERDCEEADEAPTLRVIRHSTVQRRPLAHAG